MRCLSAPSTTNRSLTKILFLSKARNFLLMNSVWSKDTMTCPNCKGSGIEEETMKGYRRYRCFMCEGEGEIPSPFADKEEDNKLIKEREKTDDMD